MARSARDLSCVSFAVIVLLKFAVYSVHNGLLPRGETKGRAIIILLAIEYVVTGMFPAGLSKDKKRVVRRKAINAIICNFASTCISKTLLTPGGQYVH